MIKEFYKKQDMEDFSETFSGSDQILQGLISESPKIKTASEKQVNIFLLEKENKNHKNVLNPDSMNNVKFKSEEVFQERGEYANNELAGVYFQGVQYFDFKNVYFINNTGIANMIDLLKSLLERGVLIKFVNVRKKIRDKFTSMGLESIFNCS